MLFIEEEQMPALLERIILLRVEVQVFLKFLLTLKKTFNLGEWSNSRILLTSL